MSKFIFFYNTNDQSIKIIKLITKFKLHHLFDIIEITSNNSHIYHKYLQTIPILITNNNNITNFNTIIEFLIRLRIHKNKIIPYSQPISLYNNLYSQIDESTKVDYYSPTYHNYNSKIPKIRTYTETQTLTIKDFDRVYNKLLKDRNA